MIMNEKELYKEILCSDKLRNVNENTLLQYCKDEVFMYLSKCEASLIEYGYSQIYRIEVYTDLFIKIRLPMYWRLNSMMEISTPFYKNQSSKFIHYYLVSDIINGFRLPNNVKLPPLTLYSNLSDLINTLALKYKTEYDPN